MPDPFYNAAKALGGGKSLENIIKPYQYGQDEKN